MPWRPATIRPRRPGGGRYPAREAGGARPIAGAGNATRRAGQGPRQATLRDSEGRRDGHRHGPEGPRDGHRHGEERRRDADAPRRKPAETAPAPKTKAAAVTAPEKTATAPKKKAPAKAAPRGIAEEAAYRRAGRTPRPHSPHHGLPVSAAFQHPRQHRRRSESDTAGPSAAKARSRRRRRPGQKVNAITCLCWDLPCGGYHVLAWDGGHIAARIGYGLQDDPAELLAMLAMAYVPSDYPLRAGPTTRTVADLVESEKLSCRSGTEMSLRLIGLSHYVEQATWKNSLDETWSIEQMVAEELSLPPLAGPRDHEAAGAQLCARPPGGQVEAAVGRRVGRAKTFVEDYQGYVLRTQSGDGGWSFRPAGGQASDRDYAVQFLTTGQIAEWLALSLPAQKLEEPSVVRAVEYLDTVSTAIAIAGTCRR